MGDAVWNAYAQSRRAGGLTGLGVSGITAPSSKNLWDIVKREHLEKLSAAAIKDVWAEVRAGGRAGRRRRCAGGGDSAAACGT